MNGRTIQILWDRVVDRDQKGIPSTYVDNALLLELLEYAKVLQEALDRGLVSIRPKKS